MYVTREQIPYQESHNVVRVKAGEGLYDWYIQKSTGRNKK
jgi:hypothetical protein